jgi:hypothetical protein
MSNRRLEAKVKAVNRANKLGLEVYQLLAPVFVDLVGTKILKADGSLLQKIENRLPTLTNDRRTRVSRSPSRYVLAWNVQTNEPESEFTVTYHEVTVYVGDVDGDALKAIRDYTPSRTDWTVAEVLEGRRKIKEAKEALSVAEASVYPFGEYDR